MSKSLLFIAFTIAFLQLMVSGYVQAAEFGSPSLHELTPDKKKAGLPTVKLYGEINMLQSSLEASGVTLSLKKLPAIIEKVRLGSPAFYANVSKGDKVLSAEIDEHKILLRIERGGHKYEATLDSSGKPPVLVGKLPQTCLAGQLSDLETHVERTEITVYGIHDLFDWWPAPRRQALLDSDLRARPEAWGKWKRNIYPMLCDIARRAGLKGWGGVHIIINHDGNVVDSWPFDPKPQPGFERDQDGTSRLIDTLKAERLLSFPVDSQVQEVHIVFRPVGQERIGKADQRDRAHDSAENSGIRSW